MGFHFVYSQYCDPACLSSLSPPKGATRDDQPILLFQTCLEQQEMQILHHPTLCLSGMMPAKGNSLSVLLETYLERNTAPGTPCMHGYNHPGEALRPLSTATTHHHQKLVMLLCMLLLLMLNGRHLETSNPLADAARAGVHRAAELADEGVVQGLQH
jgi:hypothetical protein